MYQSVASITMNVITKIQANLIQSDLTKKIVEKLTPERICRLVSDSDLKRGKLKIHLEL